MATTDRSASAIAVVISSSKAAIAESVCCVWLGGACPAWAGPALPGCCWASANGLVRAAIPTAQQTLRFVSIGHLDRYLPLAARGTVSSQHRTGLCRNQVGLLFRVASAA